MRWRPSRSPTNASRPSRPRARRSTTSTGSWKPRTPPSERSRKLLEAALNRPLAVTTPEEKKEGVRQKANKLFNDFARVKNAATQTDLAEFARDYIKVARGRPGAEGPDGQFRPQRRLPDPAPVRRHHRDVRLRILADAPARERHHHRHRHAGIRARQRPGRLGAGWERRRRAPTPTPPQLGKLAITVGEMYAMPNVSQKMLDDAYVDVEAWLAGKVAQVFARGRGHGVHQRQWDQQAQGHPDLPGGHERRLRPGAAGSTRATPRASPTWA